MTQRDTNATIEWYQSHESTGEIGFNPNGMCQKICRTARNIGSGYASALAQQIGTPEELRVYNVEDIVRGMVMFFDDPNDSNPYGHIVTVVGRAKGDRGNPANLIVRTNSVVSGRVVAVRADYFPTHWGDKFQFAGRTINGVILDLPEKKPAPKPPPPPEMVPVLNKKGRERLRQMVHVYDRMIENQKDHPRAVRALKRDRKEILETLNAKKEKK